jgi:predicted histidine transporter YuiF (NhaC family)
MKRSEVIKQWRPVVETDNDKSTEIETFQNVTLRPVLKFQNGLIISVMNNFLSEHKYEVKNLTDNKKKDHINHTIKNNLQLKQLMIGFIIGHFTDEELAFYYSDKKEVSKRIVSMLIERMCAQLENLQF